MVILHISSVNSMIEEPFYLCYDRAGIRKKQIQSNLRVGIEIFTFSCAIA